MFDKLILICLGLWAFIFGAFYLFGASSQYQHEWTFIMAFAALATGIACVVRAVR